jgi:hypothetical protein
MYTMPEMLPSEGFRAGVLNQEQKGTTYAKNAVVVSREEGVPRKALAGGQPHSNRYYKL